ncbi:MAG: MBOAT family O-acyltransferase [Lachnospiraceae bacterium]|nr:MBOAT family O-acyltransferase [Lachnospiraceae bacterium]
MIFSSLLFLFRFLPAVLLLYFISPRPIRNGVLFLVSLIFYAWGEPVYVLLMLASILSSWLGGLLVDYFRKRGQEGKAKLSLVLSVGFGLALLGFFKYTDFLLNSINQVTGWNLSLLNLALPIGISFYTFQTISYIIDVYRQTARVQKNIISYGAYVTMFPQLIAGPIVQYKTIDEQLRQRQESVEEFADGVNRFVIGLGKKVLLANNAGALWDSIRLLSAGNLPAVTAWLGLAAYTFQIYFDFSAYSDMAIGLGHMFGFRFLENFNYPYLSKSITEFWRRWHISLGTWFREYVYIPLGGNRKGTGKLIRNTMIVWLLTGIWHGADWNFLIWGLYYGLLLLAEKLFLKKYLERLPGWLQHVYCMFFVMLGWFIFVFDQSGIGYLKAMFTGAGAGFFNRETIYFLYNNGVLLIALLLGSTMVPKKLAGSLLERLKEHDWVCIVLRGVFYGAVFFLSVAYLVDASYNPFLYFRF